MLTSKIYKLLTERDVLDFKLKIFIRRNVFITHLFFLLHSLLLFLSQFCRREFAFFLPTINLVTHSIKFITLFFFFLNSWASTLSCNPIMARGCHFPILNRPNFVSQILSKFCRMRNNNDTTFKSF
ncbi:hypothetical protein WN66_05541 [Saccharomyces cerevisiae]|uniref:Putative uncharacterized protein YNL013C n=2 Tax=Saccharomyces cerevisiae TaxID=4932 RepID=YNB3_YEAST|nr:RecName: Full=Putative uncharacterized protein YNL013C [Saccharomyces cerevisiae S288C]KZV08612.1 hypothetical protein WN66_05541 [Saccharomyces cerevisiae]CAA95875.1 unnamed protein product [Saccharomyces cerevisiae]CAY82179.1 EC1118_1N18_0243p [Saccharomyces cerevisiae EC1118]